jgi:2-ketocyclohexanecarboxyl-CoA hydrolase
MLSDNILGIAGLGFQALSLYYATNEAKEGGQAFCEKRTPRFREKMQ